MKEPDKIPKKEDVVYDTDKGYLAQFCLYENERLIEQGKPERIDVRLEINTIHNITKNTHKDEITYHIFFDSIAQKKAILDKYFGKCPQCGHQGSLMEKCHSQMAGRRKITFNHFKTNLKEKTKDEK